MATAFESNTWKTLSGLEVKRRKEMRSVFVFDAHCDTLSAIARAEGLFSNHFQWDVSRARQIGTYVQVLAVFAGSKYRENPKERMISLFNKGLEAVALRPGELGLLLYKEDLDAIKNPGVYVLMGSEGGEILGGSLEALDTLFNRGLRVLTLVWNFDNELCDSVAGKGSHGGVSPLGRRVISRAQELGLVLDLSHASDKTFYDVLNLTKGPLMASHSNSRALCGHPRNLTDSQIKALAKRDGVIGINYYPNFLEKSGNAEFMSIIKHIEYFSALVGSRHIGLGSDFDGVDKLPSGIKGVEDVIKIPEALARLNYTQEAIDGIMGFNLKRLFRRILPEKNREALPVKG